MSYVLVSDSRFVPLVNDAILSGGKLYSYESGTTTPLDLYQDASGTPFANQNPLDLGSGGVQTIYIDTTKSYKFKLDNSSDVEQWVVDPVTKDLVAEEFKADLLDTSDDTKNDALVKGKRTETGAQAFTLHAFHENRNLNLKTDFGAVGDGRTNDTGAIEAAIDAANAGGGRTIEVPPGIYRIEDTITFKPGASFVGTQGNGVGQPFAYPNFKWFGADGGTMFETSGITGNLYQTVIDNIVFTGIGPTEQTPDPDRPETLWRIKERVDIGWGFHRCQFLHCTGDAIVFEKGANNFSMYDWRADSVGGYVIKAEVKDQSFAGDFEKFTWDPGPATAIPQHRGLIFLDGKEGNNNVVNQIAISNCRIEANHTTDSNENALVLLGCNAPPNQISNYVQHYVTLSNVYIPALTGVSTNFIKAVYEDDADGPEDQIVVSSMGLRRAGAITPIAGTKTPGPPASTQSAFFVFAPFVHGSPWPSNQEVHLISDVAVGKRLLQPMITVPANDTTISVAQGNIFNLANTQTTIIDELSGGTHGQIVTLLFNDAFTELSDTSFLLEGGATSWDSIAAGDTIRLILDENGKWRELCRSVNS